tara:strand:+ start:81992 stop:83113 length:1122 start_codon:yes stop_codon:yes gene_type:complete
MNLFIDKTTKKPIKRKKNVRFVILQFLFMMKYKNILLAAFTGILFVLTSCNKEPQVDLTAEWKDITVIYGLMDINDTAHYVRISKAFLGTGNLYSYAGIKDSIYYPDILTVTIEEYDGSTLKNTYPLQRVVNEIPKDSGLFYSDENILYKFTAPLNSSRTYKLKVKNGETGKEVTGETEIVRNPTINRPSPVQQISFFNNTGLPYDFKSEIVTGNKANRVQAVIKFEFWEHTATDSTLKSISFSIGTQTASSDNGGNTMTFVLNGNTFLENLKSMLSDDPSIIKRTFKSDKLNITTQEKYEVFFTYYSADKFLTTYIDVNKPANGIIQEKPDYTNITNGIGIFASRNTKETAGNMLQKDTKEKIKQDASLKFQ